jgi:hypothetical protein
MTKTTVPRWRRGSTLLLAVLTTAVVLFGFTRPENYPAVVRTPLLVQDAVVLLVGVPALLLGVRGAHRGSLAARVVWLGALTNSAYVWLSVGLQVPFNRLFLAYAALVGLSLFTLVGGVLATDPSAFREALEDRLPERLYAGAVLVIAVGLAALWLSELVPATVTGSPPALVAEVGPQALVSHFVDLSVVVPGLAVAGLWLRRERPWGYVLAGVGTVFGALLAPALTGATVVFALAGDVTVSSAVAAFTVLPALLAVGVAAGYLRALSGVARENAREAGPAGVDPSR